jgi:hypothetical protein
MTYQAVGLPSVDVVLESVGATGALALAHGKVLVKCSSSLDRGGVGASGLVDIIDTTVRSNLLLTLATNMRVFASLTSYSA